MAGLLQDPFMFSGTVRVNLDPFNTHSDDELWRVLDAVGLKQVRGCLAACAGLVWHWAAGLALKPGAALTATSALQRCL